MVLISRNFRFRETAPNELSEFIHLIQIICIKLSSLNVNQHLSRKCITHISYVFQVFFAHLENVVDMAFKDSTIRQNTLKTYLTQPKLAH